MKSVVVTGASGFLGSYLVRDLVANGYYVFAVVRPGTHNRGYLSKLQSVSTIECDLRDLGQLSNKILEPVSCFFHMAWAGVSGRDQSDYETQLQNIHASLIAMDAAKELGCARYVGAGSLHELECRKELEQSGEVMNQANAYKTAKLAAHYYCKLKASKIRIDFLWPRITNAYGIGEKSARLINSTIRQLLLGEEPALTQANQLYDFIYVSDAARAFRLIAEQGVSYENYIVGSGNVRPLKEYLGELRDTVAPGTALGFGKHPYKSVCLERSDLYSETLHRDTGFQTTIPFRQGIRLTAEWIQQSFQDCYKKKKVSI